MAHVEIIGMGMAPDDLTPAHLAMIESADLLVGGRRHLSYFPDHAGRKHEITGRLKSTVRMIRDRMETSRVVVLASGDPLFFGIGGYLTNALGPENVRIHPNLSSVAAAFARLKIPWQDATVLSLHGKAETDRLWQALAGSEKIALFTDGTRTPGWLADAMRKRGIDDLEMWVFERMGTPDEKITRYTIDDAEQADFDDLNMVVLIRQPDAVGRLPIPAGIGMPDDCFQHQRGLITKAEVRAVTLSKLRLSPGLTVWDLGAGSGSVAVEAALLMGKGCVIAVEKHSDRIGQIEANRSRFGISRMRIVHAELPDGIGGLPAPDRIFIGGGGRGLVNIIEASAACLANDGIIVTNTVLLANVAAAMDTLKKLGFETEMVQIQVNRSSRMPWNERLEAENPVFIISGKRKQSFE